MRQEAHKAIVKREKAKGEGPLAGCSAGNETL
jgi:hypothetical protein